MKNIILFLTFTFLNYFTKGQESTTSIITIRATTSVSGQAFSVDIFRNEDNIKVLYKTKESLSDKIETDSNLTKHRKALMSVKNLTPQNDTVSFYLEQIDSINQVYTKYGVDSLQFNKTENKEFDSLLNAILSSSSEILENKSVSKNNVVLDGTLIRFKITNDQTSRVIYAYSPSSTTYPLLNKLITQTLDLYRQTKNNDFLSIRKTGGY